MSSNCLPQFPFVSQNPSAHCLQASSICRPVVSQSSFKMLFPTCRLVVSRLSCKCGLPIISVLFQTCPPDSFPIVFHSTPTPHSCLLPVALVPNYFSNAFQLFTSCFPDVVFQLSPLALNLETSLPLVCTAGFIVPDSLDVCLYLPPSPFCLPLWLVVSDSLEFSFYCICFLDFPSCVSRSTVSGPLEVYLHWFLFACLPVWLSTPGGVRLSKYLSLLDHVSLTIFLRIYICVSQLICLQSSVCLSGGV